MALLKGKYRVAERLGTGGMGVVHAGMNVHTERLVAIKRLHRYYAADPAMLNRFEREARAAGRIQNPHVVQVLDIDRDEENLPFIVMERLQGESLQARLERAPMGGLEVVEITRQILRGVAAAHAAGVIHRDLKPGNIFLIPEPLPSGRDLESPAPFALVHVKLLDFGISKISDEEPGREVTRKGETLGTFSYMAPEQIRRGGTAVQQSDLWSIGVVVYLALTGHNPFDAEDQLQGLARILEQEPPRLRDYGGVEPHVADAFQPFIDQALAKSMKDRFPSAEEMSVDLERVAYALEAAGDRRPAMARRAPPPPRRARRVTWAVPLVVALVVGTATGSALGYVTRRPARAAATQLALETEPTWAAIVVAGKPVEDRAHVPVDPAHPSLARIEAPGYEPRTLELPGRAGARVVVRLGVAGAGPEPAAALPGSVGATSAANGAAVQATGAQIESVLELPEQPRRRNTAGVSRPWRPPPVTTRPAGGSAAAPRAITLPPY